jgi:uncharacterized phage infection (PIP) family protein YhgE
MFGIIHRLVRIEKTLDALLKGEKDMATTVADIKAEFEAYQADVVAKVAALNDAVTKLKAGAGSLDQAALDALAAEVTKAQADLDASAGTPIAPVTP